MLRYIDSVIDSDGNEVLTVDGRDLYKEIDKSMRQELKEQDYGEIAGLRPLPINRMVRQAGREVNRYTTTGSYGPPMRGRDDKILRNPDGSVRYYEKSRVQRNEYGYDRKSDGVFNGKIPPDMKERLIERHRRVNEAIENWDPIEASAQEDYNRLRGGRRGPIPISPLDAMELIQPIAPLDKEPYTAFPGV